MIIKVNDTDITSRLLGFKTLNEMNSDSLIIGNAICKKLELKMDNQDGELTPLIDYPFFVYYSENKLLGKFTVYEKPEKYTGELALTLWDNMYQFNSKYDTQLNYDIGTTVNAQLDEMSSITGVHIDKSNLSTNTLNKSVKWYDNTIAMRNYLGWIAELDGCNAFADVNGNIVFRDLAAALYETIDIETYDKGEKVTITRVCFDDGILKLEEGDSSANTLYLSSNNVYIDSESNLESILNKYYGLTFYSVKDVKMAGIDNLYLTDLVRYNNEFMFMPLSIEETYSGGTYSIATVRGEINTVNAEITVNKIDQSVKIRRIKTIVDQNEATMEVLAQQSSNNADEIGKLLVSTNEISTELKKKVGEDEIISKINQTAEAIKILAKYIQLEGIITANGNIKIHEDGSLEAKNAKFAGKVEGSSFSTVKTTEYTYTQTDLEVVQSSIMNDNYVPTENELARYDLDLDGLITARDYVRIKNILNGKYGATSGKATFVDNIKINLDGSGKIVTERYLNGTRLEYMEFNAGSIVKSGDGSIMINGEPVITEISGTIARFG